MRRAAGLLAVVALVAFAFAAPAQAAGMPIESVGAVYVMPTSAEPGFVGGLLTLGLPIIPDSVSVMGAPLKDVVKGAAVIEKRGAGLDLDDISLYPGIALAVQKDIGVKTYVGICFLPTVKYRTAWFGGVDLFTVEF